MGYWVALAEPFFFFFKSPCTNFYNRNYCFGLIFGWVSVSLVWCCTTWYVCFSPLMYCYLNPQRTCFLSPCKNFYSKNYLFVLIFELGLREIIVFFFLNLHVSYTGCLIKCLRDIWLLL